MKTNSAKYPTGILLAALLLATQVAVAQSKPANMPSFLLQRGEMVDVGGYKLNTYCLGEGSPTVVFEAGAAWGAVAWAELIEKVAAVTRVCAYDRAGINFSDLGPVERSVGQDTADLDTWLRVHGETGPFLLVGWSAGGMIAREFAWKHPEKVAGIVTVDGSTFDFEYSDDPKWNPRWQINERAMLEELARAAHAGTLETDEKLFHQAELTFNPVKHIPELREAIKAQMLNPDSHSQRLNAARSMEEQNKLLVSLRRPFGDVPLRVLVAGEHAKTIEPPNEARTMIHADFLRHSYAISRLSTDSMMIVVPEVGHGIQLDNPKLVTKIILDTVQAVRDKASK